VSGQRITAAKQDAEFVQAANAIFKGARSAKCFAFAISFCTFNKVYRLRQFSAFKSAPRFSRRTLAVRRKTFDYEIGTSFLIYNFNSIVYDI
jgi:hypothetical protein